MFRSLNDVIAPNGMDKLPMLPDIHDVYMSDPGMVMFGGKKKRKRKVTKRRKPKRKVTKRKRKVKRKSVTKKRKTVPKSLKNQAKKHGIKLTVKRGDKRVAKTEKILRAQVMRKMKAKKAKKVVKRKTVKRRKTKRSSGFGTYWDNTQLLYAQSAASQQPAGTSGGNPYPYEGDMMPFFTVGDKTTVPYPMFGKSRGRKGRKGRFGMPTAPMNRGMWNGSRSTGSRNYQPNSYQVPLNGLNSPSGMVNDQTPMGQGVSRNYCKEGTQCGSFPRAITQAYPFTTDTRNVNFGKKKKTASRLKRR